MAASQRSSGRAFRRYFLWLAVPFTVAMLLVSFLNTWVNPLWLTPAPWSDPGFAEYKPIHKYPRSGKAGLVRSGKWDTVMLGSSRVDIAFDPTLPQWQGRKVANLALRGGTLNEHLAMLTYAASHQKIDLAIIGIDLADVTNPITIPAGSGFDESPLAESNDEVERELRYISGVSTFVQTVKCMNYRFGKKPRLAAYSPEGQWVRQLDKRPLRQVLEKESFRWVDIFTRQRKASLEVKTAKTDALHGILKLCREKNIRLILCIPPNHAAYLTGFRLKHDPDPCFRTDRDAFTKVLADEAAAHPGGPQVELWDFNDFHPLNCEPLPPDSDHFAQYWADGTHALPSLGKTMLSRMMGWPVEDPKGADYGEKLDRSTLDARIQHIADGYERYKIEHPEDYRWVQENMEKFDR
ncbi:hypothetical protein KBB96_14370 [Luteolibacter ambystomatis]|uniref:Uncharacterized protein n=1 Tax=Luteolibacter ambystomatis TaxID=2824561 RepID=A0A975G761_9BACT|nr:hypothetical protein [Luteolibacter ambystomatis]QUE50048.1 hypothetical protein KBB96_14370 [Luteolibacter ambystomatis]